MKRYNARLKVHGIGSFGDEDPEVEVYEELFGDYMKFRDHEDIVNKMAGWEKLVVECERLLGCSDHAENPQMSNLLNLIRDQLSEDDQDKHYWICVGEDDDSFEFQCKWCEIKDIFDPMGNYSPPTHGCEG